MKRWMGLLWLFSLHYGELGLAAESVTAPLTFSVLTYQVQTASTANLPLIGRKLDPYDIAAVQGCYNRCDAILAAANHPNKYYFSDRPIWWNRTNSGLASVSNFPLIEVKKTYFKAQSNFLNEKGSKGVLLMRYDVNGHTLDVYNAQIQPGQEQLDIAARQFQALELVQYVNAESPPEHTVILVGDFNVGKEKKPAIKAKLKLEDPAESLPAWFEHPFDRVLFRSGSNTVFKPIAWQDLSEVFVDAAGAPLSQDAPIAVQFSLE